MGQDVKGIESKNKGHQIATGNQKILEKELRQLLVRKIVFFHSQNLFWKSS